MENNPKTYKPFILNNSMDIKRLIDTLSSLERKVIPFLEKSANFENLVENSKLQEVEVLRALQFLENKEIVKVEIKENKIITLTDKAKVYKELPERIVLNNLSDKETTLEELKNKTKLNDAEINVSIGLLKRNSLIDVIKDKTLKIKLIKNAEKSNEEHLFSKLLNKNLEYEKLDQKEKQAFESLRSRGLVNLNTEKQRSIIVTDLGKQLSKEKIDTNIIESLTQEVIRNKEWKKKKLRSYDIQAQVPTMIRGKRHFVDQSIEYIRRIWLDMGFKEMTGPIVETSFWDLDALFVPQDHPAREMQDTFYVSDGGALAKGDLPKDFSIRIQKVHENGGNTGSKGWGGKWNPEIAKELLLRTHTTNLSARKLSTLKKEDLPAKFFSIGKVYRNEALDWKHLFEFSQIDGIVVDPNANFRNLLGYLKQFFKKMGYEKARFRPSYYPYTEPSVGIEVFHPVHKKWIELGGAGIFRPEVTKPLLGFECPVLAWGPGFDRIILEFFKINDVRELFKNDIKQLRDTKEFLM